MKLEEVVFKWFQLCPVLMVHNSFNSYAEQNHYIVVDGKLLN